MPQINPTGIFEIGDTLTGGPEFSYEEIPSFAPEHFVRAYLADPMRRKQLKTGLDQLAQEGTIQLYRPPEGRSGDPVLGAVGRLQLEVVKFRLKNEYDVDVRLEPMDIEFARWVSRERVGTPVIDVRNRPVVLFGGQWQLNSAERTFKGIVYSETAHGGAVKRE